MANLSMTLWCQVANRYELLAYTEPGGCIDAALIANLGEAWMRDGQHRNYLVGLEAESRGGGYILPTDRRLNDHNGLPTR